MNFPAHQSFRLTEDALRGDGVLFDTNPDELGLVSLWNNINIPVGIIASLAGNLPRYRYEVQVVPEGSSRSKIVVNVRGQNVTEAQLEEYKASHKLHLFAQVDKLARDYPPPAETPAADLLSGGDDLDAALDADRVGDERRRADVGHALLERVDRQRRGHRLPPLPERQPGRHFADDELPVQRARVRDELHAGRGGRGCGG